MDRGWNDLVSRSVDLGVGMWRLYGNTMRDVATGKLAYDKVADRALGLARDEGGTYARAVTRAYLDYWNRLLDIGLDLQDRMASDVAATSSRTSGAGTSGAGTSASLTFTGKAGEQVARPFVVANNQPEAVDVSFEAAAFVDPDGQTIGRLPLTVDPERFSLAPGVEQVVTCRVTLTDTLAPGRACTSRLRVIGFPDMTIALVAMVG